MWIAWSYNWSCEHCKYAGGDTKIQAFIAVLASEIQFFSRANFTDRGTGNIRKSCYQFNPASFHVQLWQALTACYISYAMFGKKESLLIARLIPRCLRWSSRLRLIDKFTIICHHDWNTSFLVFHISGSFFIDNLSIRIENKVLPWPIHFTVCWEKQSLLEIWISEPWWMFKVINPSDIGQWVFSPFRLLIVLKYCVYQISSIFLCPIYF